MTRRAILWLAVLAAGWQVARLSPARADSGRATLAAWRWKSRLLLVFAPGDRDAQLLHQRDLLAAARPGNTERDLEIVEIIGSRASAPLDAVRLRAEYRVTEAQFVVLLIGKDGGEKLRSFQAVAPEQLFATIDRMPMRRAEAARR